MLCIIHCRRHTECRLKSKSLQSIFLQRNRSRLSFFVLICWERRKKKIVPVLSNALSLSLSLFVSISRQ